MLTLRQVIEDSDLRIELVVNTGRLDTEIRWTHVTELPDPRPYLGAGELVITNGIGLEACSPSEFIKRLCEGEAAGLLFGLRHSVADVPPDLVAACAQNRLPLLALPANVPFTAVTKKVAEAHAGVRTARLVETIQRRDALVAAASNGGGLRNLLTTLTVRNKTPIALANRYGKLLEVVFPPLSAADSDLMSQAARDMKPETELVLSDGTEVTALAVASGGEPDFTLLYGRKLADITDMEWGEINQLIRLISIHRSRQRAVNDVQQQFADEVLQMALAGPHRTDELAFRLKSFDIDPNADIGVFAVIRQDRTAGGRDVGDCARDFFTERGLTAIAPESGSETIAIVSLDGAEEDMAALAESLRAQLRKWLGPRAIAIGVSRPVRGHLALRVGLLQAREAARAAMAGRDGDVVLFTGSQSHQLLIRMLDDSARLEFAQSVLEPIIDYDRENNTDLVRTLRFFFAHDGRLTTTASEMHVHVNTLRNRLERVQELTGRDISVMANRTDLFLALQIVGEL